MFNLFKKETKYKPITEYPEDWAVIKSEYNGHQIFIRLRSGLKDAIGHSDFPYLFAVLVQINQPNENGMPSEEEGKNGGKLFQIEEALIKHITENNEGVFAFVTTLNGERQFHFYVKKWEPEYYHEKVRKVQENFKDYKDFETQMGKDPEWFNFKKLFD